MQLTLKDVGIMLTFPAVMSFGQILFREVAIKQAGKPLLEILAGVAVTPLFYVALTFYAFATILWIWLLTKYPLTIAYPIAVLAVIFAPLIDKFFFRHPISNGYWFGIALIICGVQVITRTH